jgi:polysaccharide deacetylase 2 family uncharacterized protein YibQ
VTSSPPSRSGPKPGAIAQMLSGGVLLGVLVAAAGYIFMAPGMMAEGPGVGAPEGTKPADPDPPKAGQMANTGLADPIPETMPEPGAAPEPQSVPNPEPESATIPEAPSPSLPSPSPPPPSSAADTPEPPKPAKIPKVTKALAPADTQVAALTPDPELAWRRNRQPFNETDPRPRIAVVLTGLGLAGNVTEAAIEELPGGVTLSFTPYSRKLNHWVAQARLKGHEVMLDLPMEPTSYPDDDPGPQALLTALSPRQNLDRLRWTLDRATGYVGLAAVMGSRFAASREHMGPVLEELRERGLLFLDNRASDRSLAAQVAGEIGVPNAVNDRFLDRTQASRVAIDARLVQVENLARGEGFAVAMGRPNWATIERLSNWAKELEARGIALAPISALANRQSRIAQAKTATE